MTETIQLKAGMRDSVSSQRLRRGLALPAGPEGHRHLVSWTRSDRRDSPRPPDLKRRRSAGRRAHAAPAPPRWGSSSPSAMKTDESAVSAVSGAAGSSQMRRRSGEAEQRRRTTPEPPRTRSNRLRLASCTRCMPALPSPAFKVNVKLRVGPTSPEA